MKIVVTNDDGIDAQGLATLAEVCRGFGETVIVAPGEPHSALGHRVTTGVPIPVAQQSPSAYRVDGTPADCSRLALTCLTPDADWVISGINHGGNLGADVYMSGTVAAAREAALLGRRAIAISHYIARGGEVDWAAAAVNASRVLRMLLERELPSGFYWNVNLPYCAEAEDISFCPLDPSPLHVRYRKEGSVFIYEGDYHGRERRSGSDVDLCFQGRITVTAIPLEFAHPFSTLP
ncbi:MAG: 5'/3'-nucleotidase SurE [Bryobacteraceae bacterium]|nr:5'/3'-nucleotidase SurE [Bryobacteraceae bacterium]